MIPKEGSPYFVDGFLKDPTAFPPTKARHVRHRQTLKEIVRPRDAEFYDVVKNMLRVDPDDRITAREALLHPFFSEMKSSSATARSTLNVASRPSSAKVHLSAALSKAADRASERPTTRSSAKTVEK